jgi:hypothetical protein
MTVPDDPDRFWHLIEQLMKALFAAAAFDFSTQTSPRPQIALPRIHGITQQTRENQNARQGSGQKAFVIEQFECFHPVNLVDGGPERPSPEAIGFSSAGKTVKTSGLWRSRQHQLEHVTQQVFNQIPSFLASWLGSNTPSDHP